jgi:hypothetical protein
VRRSAKTLSAQLDAHSAAVKPLAANGAARLANWSVYAVATGSALAMATSANAGIIYSGPLALTKSITPAVSVTNSHFVFSPIYLNTGVFANPSNLRLLLDDGREYGNDKLYRFATAAFGYYGAPLVGLPC